MTSSRPLPSDADVSARYEHLVSSGVIDSDPAQRDLVGRLDALSRILNDHKARKRGVLDRFFGNKPQAAPDGLYVRGSVGRGKTMLMDLFFDSLTVQAKRRTHFHSYMAEVHERIHAWRQQLKAGTVEGDDPIRPVAKALAGEAWVLCFDEFAVTDIADAMILGRLFTAMLEQGIVVVATSNVPPDGLYKDGLNRSLFLPFIRLLSERTDVVKLESRTDFRLEKIGDAPVYFSPADDEADRAVTDLFGRLTSGAVARPETLTVHGHPVVVPSQVAGVARFDFTDLCAKPLGSSDFLAIARNYDTLVIERVPILKAEQRNEVRRFITLIDVLYEQHVKLVISAAAGPDELYHAETGAEAFEFARTASRLHEMRSREYLAAPRRSVVTGNATGLVDT